MRTTMKMLFAMPALMLASMPAFATLPIQNWQTGSGARVYFVESHALPILDISIDFPAGSAYDTPDKSGLAALTQGTLNLGAGGLDEDAIASKLADVGAELNGRFDTDRSGVTLRTLTNADQMQQALDVYTRVVQSPEFPKDVIERERNRTVDELKDADTKPGTIADENFDALVYGNHPYALRANGTPETVAKLTRDDVVAFYKTHYTADHAVVSIVGDLSRKDAEALAERLTSGLPRADANTASIALPTPTPLTQAVVKVIPHPATQSHILIGQPGIKRGDPDYFPLYVGNYILGGGGFDSRILKEVREKRGLAYSAYSYFTPLLVEGPFTVGLETRKDQANEALTVTRDTLTQFIADGPTADELKQAKNNLIGGFPLRIDSNKKILEALAAIGFYQLPLTYLDDFTTKVDKVTIADIRDAFKRRIDPTKMVTVVVGPESLDGSSVAPANPPSADDKK